MGIGKSALRDAVLVAVTGLSQAQDRRRSRAAGFDHHFAKPVDIDALTALLNHEVRVPVVGRFPRTAEARLAGN